MQVATGDVLYSPDSLALLDSSESVNIIVSIVDGSSFERII